MLNNLGDSVPKEYDVLGRQLTSTMMALLLTGTTHGVSVVIAVLCSVIHFIEKDLNVPVRDEINKIIDEAIEWEAAQKH